MRTQQRRSREKDSTPRKLKVPANTVTEGSMITPEHNRLLETDLDHLQLRGLGVN
jgi:hypothetical protein